MKKILLAGFSILTGLQLFAGTVFTSAHNNPSSHSAHRDLAVPSAGSGSGGSMSGLGSGSAVSERLLRNFHESFPNAEKVIWRESADSYEVSFVAETILTRISYDKDGEFIASLRYYTEKNLPYYLINIVNHKYHPQKIYGVTEVSNRSDILYYVKLEGPKFWLTVLLDSDGTSSVTEKFRKAL